MINEYQVIYNSRIYQHENIYNNILDPKIYLSRYINILLRSIVGSSTNYSNKVIGCDPFFVDIISNNIKFVISAGTMIIDSTLIEIKSPVFLDIDLNLYSQYKTIVILAGYKFNHLANGNKASFQVCFVDPIDNSLKTNGSDLISKGLDHILVLGKFELVRDLANNLIAINQPYGLFRNRFYSEFLTTKISPLATAQTNKIFTLLTPKADLYKPFLINNNEYKITLPLYMGGYWDGINRYLNDKMQSRYMVDHIDNYYHNNFDFTIHNRTEIFNDEYSYSI